MTTLTEQMRLLREMTANDIARQGEAGAYESTMVRAGLLLDIIDLALSAPDLVEALEDATTAVESIKELLDAEETLLAWQAARDLLPKIVAALWKAKGSPS